MGRCIKMYVLGGWIKDRPGLYRKHQLWNDPMTVTTCVKPRDCVKQPPVRGPVHNSLFLRVLTSLELWRCKIGMLYKVKQNVLFFLIKQGKVQCHRQNMNIHTAIISGRAGSSFAHLPFMFPTGPKGRASPWNSPHGSLMPRTEKLKFLPHSCTLPYFPWTLFCCSRVLSFVPQRFLGLLTIAIAEDISKPRPFDFYLWLFFPCPPCSFCGYGDPSQDPASLTSHLIQLSVYPRINEVLDWRILGVDVYN